MKLIGQIASRQFTSDCVEGSPEFNAQVLMIPGGPGIPGDYCDAVAKDLAVHHGITTIVIDLPFHDDSRPFDSASLPNYMNAVEMLKSYFSRLAVTKPTFIFGHSFGARLALDLAREAADARIPVAGVGLISFAADLGVSPLWEQNKAKLNITTMKPIDNSTFSEYWKSILPLYFQRHPDPEWIKILSKKVDWKTFQMMTETMPSLAKGDVWNNEVAVRFFDGLNDLRIPNGNPAWIERNFPKASQVKLSDCGHFPMLESRPKLSEEIARFVHTHT